MKKQKIKISIITYLVCLLVLGGCGSKQRLDSSILSKTESVTEEQIEKDYNLRAEMDPIDSKTFEELQKKIKGG